jgi:hypothetical protein
MQTKHFFGTMPLQSVKSAVYHCEENSKLNSCYETAFPGLLMIKGYADKGDNIKVSVVITEDVTAKSNFRDNFLVALEKLTSEIGCSYEVNVISTDYNETIENNHRLFCDLIARIDNNEQLFASITYGTKPTPILLSMALSYGYKLRENTDIRCILI